jgi:16S rRNA (guanine527-N7)-methyltransferase
MTGDGPAPLTGVETEPRLVRYLEELYRWNERINLTSIPRDEAEQRHLAEARHLLVRAGPATGARVADIGAGGGVPGLVMAILRPDLRVTLIESDRRKAGFLLHAAAVCDCPLVTVEPRRAEEVGRDAAHRAGYDLVVSRATASAPVLCELALPLLRLGGRLVALVTGAEAGARAAAAAASACGGGPPAALAPGILAITKVAPTPDLYPRRAGTPARRPLQPG